MKPVAIISVAIAALVGFVFWMQYVQANQSAAEMGKVHAQARLEDCKALVEAVEAGDRAEAERQFGARVKDAVALCRNLISLHELTNAKPAPDVKALKLLAAS